MWNRAHQNGVAFNGLLAHLCEQFQRTDELRVARITVDIYRPVPFQPIATSCRIVKDGRRMQIVEADIIVADQPLARATALRVRVGQSPPAPPPQHSRPLPEAAGDRPLNRAVAAGCPIETRMVTGSYRESGPGSFWSRANSDIIEGEETSPLARVVMAADMASGPSSIVPATHWSYANIDLTIYLTRSLVGPWVFIDTQTFSAGDSTAVVNSSIGDREGQLGVAHQVLYLAPVTARS
jgi:hypothetical protein